MSFGEHDDEEVNNTVDMLTILQEFQSGTVQFSSVVHLKPLTEKQTAKASNHSSALKQKKDVLIEEARRETREMLFQGGKYM